MYVGPDVDHQEKKIPAGAAKVDDFRDHGAPAQCRKWAKQGKAKISIHCLYLLSGPCYLPKILTYSLLDPS